MKTLLRFTLLLVLAVAVQAMAAFESVKFSPVNPRPQFPATLITQGVTEGNVIFAISITADGTLRDSLVLGYTHEPFVRVCREVMKDWRFIPARMDGQNVPVQIELKFDFKREGVVETNSINITNHFLNDRFLGMAGRRMQYRLPLASEIDHMPVAVTTVDPVYAQQAEKEGVRGKVRVYFYIDEQGRVRMPSVMADTHPYLSDIAVTALQDWRFQPATQRGEPVLVAASQEFDFGGVR